jgi:penicillin-binding protein 1C
MIKKGFHTFKIWTRKFKKRLVVFGFPIFLLWFIFCLPANLFQDSTSTVLLDRNGNLLGAKIADDGQWRFPEKLDVPPKFAACLIEFEDKNFYTHIGISAKGIGRALVQNFKSKKVVSGGSTITMQLARVMRKNPARTYSEKIVEMLLALRIEIRYSKDEILGLYASHAPFGSNVVGLETASWRFFGRSAANLSWAENATLAVLPNAPGLIYPGKNHDLLLEKRNRLLKQLYDKKVIDATTFELAISEPLPDKPLRLPQLAPHLLEKFIQEGKKGQLIECSIDQNLQEKAMLQLQIHHELLSENQIMNGAIMITSVKTGEVLAYVGNTKTEDVENSSDVNCIQAPRSTGSILKPFLFAKSLEDGILTPDMLVTDIPSQFGSFTPKNFSGQYDGALPASKALSRSLNIPMVHLLNQYGLTKFYEDLKKYGMTTLTKPSRHYGLSLILGGAEAKLFELNSAYMQMAQELKFGYTMPCVLTKKSSEEVKNYPKKTKKITDRGCIYSTFDAMVEVNRPDEDNNWRTFSSSQKIAWKTGTSFGFRDAWAIGITPDYVVTVWVGNADGEGRPGLTGISAAAPLMFDVFRQLPTSEKWFKSPKNSLVMVPICHESGHRASGFCVQKDWRWIPKTSLDSKACPYHQLIHLSKTTNQRVDSDCENVFNMKHEKWFVLPSIIEKYYKFNHPNYKPLPEYKAECLSKISDKAIGIIYPKNKNKIYVPIEIDGKQGRTIFEATHRNMNTKIYWHLDDNYIGETKEIHQLSLNPSVGLHKLMLVDENGIMQVIEFEVIGK